MEETRYYPRSNWDGSVNVRCRRCGRFVGSVAASAHFSSVTECAICAATDEGLVFTEDQLAELCVERIGGITLSEKAAMPDRLTPPDPMSQGRAENMTGLRHLLKVVALKTRAAIKAAAETKVPQSKKIADEKRRKRVFDLPLDELLDGKEQ